MNEEAKKPKSGFFAVDRRTWAKVTGLGMNAMVAYLVLARGTARDNRTTAWSVQAIESYTSISRSRAKAAITALINGGLIKILRSGTKPKYDLLPWAEIDPPPPAKITPKEQEVLEMVRAGILLSGRQKATCAQTLTRKGLLAKDGDDFGLAELRPFEPDWIWLPNELVTGADRETPPVERVRQSQDKMLLRLLIDLYHGQMLREDGGISRQHYRAEWGREKIGQAGEYAIWAFYPKSSWVWWTDLTTPYRREELTEEEIAAGTNRAVDFFKWAQRLSGLGLIEETQMLFESETEEGEIIHPLGEWAGKSSIGLENELGKAAYDAAASMLSDGQRAQAAGRFNRLVPMYHHLENVQLIGVYRLRYRPHTRMTGAWYANLMEKSRQWLEKYRSIIAEKTSDSKAA